MNPVNLTHQPYGKEGQFINSVSRGMLNKRLVEVAETYDNVNIRFDQKCVRYNTKTTELLMQDQSEGFLFRLYP